MRKIKNINKSYNNNKPPKVNLSDDIQLNALQKAKLGCNYVLLILWASIILLPVIGIIISAFNTSSENYLNLTDIKIGFDNFVNLFKTDGVYFVNWLINSLVVSVCTMALTVFMVSLTGYAYSRFRFKGRKISILAIMLIQMIPSILALIAFYIINQLLNSSLGFPAYASLIVIYSGGAIAGNTFVLKGYLDSISTEIDDSAKLDGCGNVKTYIRIIMPLARPMLAIIALWSFIGPFGDVILPKILISDPQQYTLPVGLYSLLQPNSDKQVFQPLYAAGSLLTAIPITAAFMYSQKHLVSGLTSGGVKG